MNRFLLIDGKRFELIDDMITMEQYNEILSKLLDDGWVLLHHRPMNNDPGLLSIYGWRP